MREFGSRKEFWNWQVRKLIRGGMQKASGLSRAEFTDQLDQLKEDFCNAEGNDIIIVPQSIVSLTAKMPLVTLKTKLGYCCIDPWDIAKETTVPRGFYLALDVEDGRKTLGIPSNDCVKKFENTNRLALAANEGAMLVYY